MNLNASSSNNTDSIMNYISDYLYAVIIVAALLILGLCLLFYCICCRKSKSGNVKSLAKKNDEGVVAYN